MAHVEEAWRLSAAARVRSADRKFSQFYRSRRDGGKAGMFCATCVFEVKP